MREFGAKIYFPFLDKRQGIVHVIGPELGITQPRLNALLKGRIGLFSLDVLVEIARRSGLSVRLAILK